MALTIEESGLIAAPPAAVWRLLADPTTWRLWWRACLEAETKDRKALRDGSELVLVLKPSWLTLRFRPRVEVAQPERALIWVGTGGGVTGRHAFYLDTVPNGTRVRQREDFTGWGVPLLGLLGMTSATRRMFRDNLRGLKQLAERSV